MSIEDPKETLKTLIQENMTLYKDDGTTPASVLVSDEYVEDFWRKYDVIITVGLESQRDKLLSIGCSHKETVSLYRVTVWTCNRTGVNGQLMRWKAVQEVNRIISENMKNPGGSIEWMKTVGRTSVDKVEVKPALYSSTILVETHQYAS